MEPVRCVGRRVDAFVMAFRVRIAASLRAFLDERKLEATTSRHGVFVESSALGAGCLGLKFAVSPRGERGILLENSDVAAFITEADGLAGWCLEIRVFAGFLGAYGLREAIAMARAVAGLFGEWRKVDERCRRIDLCADFEGFADAPLVAGAFVTRQRAKITRFNLAGADVDSMLDADGVLPEARTYSVGGAVTGLAICYGAPLCARIYNKSVELEHVANAAKSEREKAVWKLEGWKGGDVWRVEGQIRGDVLHEMGLRDDVDLLAGSIDAIWQYIVSDWVSLRVPGKSRLIRCPLDARWLAVQGVVFSRAASAAVRQRRRGGASLEQALGCMLSALASTDEFEKKSEVLAPRCIVSDDGAAIIRIRRALVAVTVLFRDTLERALFRESPRESWANWVQRVWGLIGRFSLVPEGVRHGR